MIRLADLISIEATLTQRHVGWNHGIRARFYESEGGLLRRLFDIIEENAADSSGLATMRNEEVFVAPFFESVTFRRMPSNAENGVYVCEENV